MSLCVRLVAVVISLMLGVLPVSALAQGDDEQQMIERITLVFPDTEGEITAMRDAGYGWGVIIMILHLAQLSADHGVDDIRAMFESGKGLGEIAQELNIHPGELGRIVASVMSGGRSETGDAASEDRGKPEWAPGPPAGVPGRP